MYFFYEVLRSRFESSEEEDLGVVWPERYPVISTDFRLGTLQKSGTLFFDDGGEYAFEHVVEQDQGLVGFVKI